LGETKRRKRLAEVAWLAITISNPQLVQNIDLDIIINKIVLMISFGEYT
jgi:hypothetical protein